MPVAEYELDAVLAHCRSLVDAADAFDDAARARAIKAEEAIARWEGPHRITFDVRFEYEAADLAARVRGMRDEADQWARVWAESVNHINQRRRQAAVDQISSQRGFGESFVDIFVGDDSGEQVRSYQPVSVPSVATRYAPTGGLETF